MARRLGSVQAGFSSSAKKNPSCSGQGSNCAGPPSARRARRASGVRAAKASITASFSSGNTEQVTYSNLPPGRARAKARRECAPAAQRTPAISAARRSHLMSGCRRATPEAEQGTSARMRSKAAPSDQAPGRRQSAARTSAASPRRARFRVTSAQRAASTSMRGQRDIRRSRGYARSCRRAPRRHRARAVPPANPATRPRAARPQSCTETSPSAKPGRRSTGTGFSSSRASSADTARWNSFAERGALRTRRPSMRRAFTRRHIGGCRLPAASTCCHAAG